MSSARLELWGGPECTRARVGDSYVDQVELTGHASRIDDLERFASLGLDAIRYPVLWERTAPESLASADWAWPDERLRRLRKLGVRPIVGLVHHGSGPLSTSLLDDAFPERLAAYARLVAERYPWVVEWTPVNEPLTTARFSALYGHWFPHARDDRAFARALVNQCRAVALSMAEIRAVIPGALLVQTEDVGKAHSTPALEYQADFENERRFLTFDLLRGTVAPGHPLWEWLTGCGVTPGALESFAAAPCPPDVLGVNHYLTSERFLDERLERYPAEAYGGNGRQAYADVEAVRVLEAGVGGPGAVLREVWERYRLPVAVTEVHNGCTREEQLRWAKEVWEAARTLLGEGADVRAVTLWSLLGAFDWDSLLTRRRGRYEPGVFDARSSPPRATALAGLARGLRTGDGGCDHPVLDGPGWWHRPPRLLYPPVGPARPSPVRRARRPRMLAIVGATGTLGRAFSRICARRGLAHELLARRDLDIADPGSVDDALDRLRPWAVVNAAGYVRVDDAESDEARCRRENTRGPALLAAACAARGIGLVAFSSDLVFDGEKREPYVESDVCAPLSAYGRSKAEAERLVLGTMPEALVVRTSAFFGPWDAHNFAVQALRTLQGRRRFAAASDVTVSPTYVPDLVDATLDLLIDGERGVWHLANAGSLTWASFATTCAEVAGLDPRLVHAVPLATLASGAPRPGYSTLGTERGALMPRLEDALERLVSALEPELLRAAA